jgi:MFS family permease
MSFKTLPSSVYLLALCQALMMSGTTLLITASALVCYTLTEDKTLTTLPLSLQFLGLMLTSIPASLIMGRWGRKVGFMLGSLFGIVGGTILVLATLNHQFWWFAAGSFLIGIFNGFGTYYRFAAVDMVDVKNRPKAISYVMVGGVVAAFIGPNLASFGSNMFDSEKFAGGFVFMTIFYVMVFALMSFMRLPKVTTDKLQSSGRPLKEILKQPAFVVAVLCGMLGYGVMSYVMTATPLAMQHHGHVFDETAFVIQWHVLAMFVPSFFTGSIIQRFGVLNVMIVGAILGLTCMLVNLFGTSVWHFWLALVALGISWNFLFIGASTYLTYSYKAEEKAKAQAFNDFAVFTMVTIASLSAGFFQHKFGWRVVNLGVIPFIGIILVSIFWLKSLPENKRISLENEAET